ncbi:helix-turn-helix domain-containing protein [Salmonella enterica]|nr:helix-turn-helix domain-containing protein [Salmonella enterica]EBN4822341.1 helix-turn-helix domain-containing protein [Salmonella enterica]
MKTIAEQIGERLKTTRQNRGLSMGRLAKLCGWSGSSRIANYEAGTRSIGAEDAITLGQVLGISPAELMFGKQENANSWLSDNQQKLLELFNQLPASEQTRMLDLFEIRLKEIDEYVEQYLRSRQHKKDTPSS